MSAVTERNADAGQPASKEAVRIQEILDATYEKFRRVDDGAVATYIPELGKADPLKFAICLVTRDGHVFRAGDCDHEFTIQSMCKPLAFLMALEQYGPEETQRYVGVEPSGDAFNSIELDPKTGRPFNPMVNAGAIAISSLVRKGSFEEGVNEWLSTMSAAAGRQLRIDESVLHSETLTGDRNRAIAYLLRNFGILDEKVNETLQQYFAQCSTLVNCKDMAIIAATLANMGINPITGERVFGFEFIKYVLSVMLTCGLYDYAGSWAYEVGLPAKSGVSGGIFGVVNRQLGISVYSPKLDAQGNSVRGILACKELANHFGLHAFEFMNVGSTFVQWLL
jgi:glutaminase